MQEYANIINALVRYSINRKVAELIEPPLIWVEDTTPASNRQSTPYYFDILRWDLYGARLP
jgi:hypothetical protein